MKRRTKIVCTLGPAVSEPDKLKALVDSGMNVARLNCSHGDWAAKEAWIDTLRDIAPDVAVLADLQGPKIRIGEVPDGMIEVGTGSILTVSLGEPDAMLKIPNETIFEELAMGDRVLLGDGNVELIVVERNSEVIQAEVISGGTIRSKQGITVVGRSFKFPCLTDKDIADVEVACQLGVDFIALSYVREAADIRQLRRLIDHYDPTIRVCAKIETQEALRDIEEIIQTADVIMVARGDLGLQMDIEDVPMAQQKIIIKCLEAGKPVITATQMLESMISAPRPTRAEATDIANAVMQGTDALMLSGETAMGQYPLEAVRIMSRIAETTERHFDHEAHFAASDVFHSGRDSIKNEAVAQAAVQLANSLNAKAIVCTSTSGRTPQLVSKFRPECPIYCATWSSRIRCQLAVTQGVQGVRIDMIDDSFELIQRAIDACLSRKWLRVGDTVVVTAGMPAGVAGHTNLIQLEIVK